MKIFTPSYFLRHISAPLLREFMEGHPLGPRLTIDWDCPDADLSERIVSAVEALDDHYRIPPCQRKRLPRSATTCCSGMTICVACIFWPTIWR